MKEIKLTQGFVALVDDDDYEELSKYKWHARKSPTKNSCRVYAVRDIRLGVNKRCAVHMHRSILGLTDKSLIVDHIDGNGLNNQKNNIRPCNHSENHLNVISKLESTSKYVGVSHYACPNRKQHWIAKLEIGGKLYHCGRHYTEYDAALARDKYILEHGFEFPKLNILTR